ncbi:MAG: nucleoside deaminase [Bacteroidetes bacterium]|nr:nucleoside deaminase [Bacteroidota bacterium]
MSTPQKYMERCLELAQKAAAEGESPVGSILVKNGTIIGEASEMSRQLKDITRHAEMLAILDAIKNNHDVAGSTIYSNVEPCILCSYAIRHYKIAEVVYSRPAGELGGTNPPFDILTAHFNSWAAPPIITNLPAGNIDTLPTGQSPT